MKATMSANESNGSQEVGTESQVLTSGAGTMKAEAPTGDLIDGENSPNPMDVVVEEKPAISSIEVKGDTLVVPVAKALPKVRLFWQKACGNTKESTMTEIKSDEVFTRTSHLVHVQMEEGAELIPNLVYSLKRGKRVYYTPSSYLLPEMILSADAVTDAKIKVKSDADAKKTAEKAAKDAEKLATVANEPKVVGPVVVAAPVVAEPVVAEPVVVTPSAEVIAPVVAEVTA